MARTMARWRLLTGTMPVLRRQETPELAAPGRGGAARQPETAVNNAKQTGAHQVHGRAPDRAQPNGRWRNLRSAVSPAQL
jgi:hypothetical protein